MAYLSALDGQFWLQEVGSTASLEGSVPALPFSPPLLAQLQPSGLSRPQARPALARRRAR